MAFNSGRIDTGTGSGFNGVFLAYVIVCGVLSVFFLLYFNRVFASAVSWGIRAWSWHRYRIYIDITALQISLLGGRVFFTGLRYHGNNETVLVQNGHITWSYWLRRVRDADVGNKPKTGEGDRAVAASRLPCRVNVAVHGVEWFVYNRSAAYDSVLAGLAEEDGHADAAAASSAAGSMRGDTSGLRSRSGRSAGSREADAASGDGQESKQEPRTSTSHYSSRNSLEDRGGQDGSDLPLMLRLFPINVECQTAALVMGNENTKAILIVKADSVASDIDASDTETNTPDPYRQIFRLRFRHPVIEIKDNLDHRETQAERAVRERQAAQPASRPVPTRSFFRRQRRRIVGQIRGMVPYWRRSVESFSSGSRQGPAVADGTPQIPGFHHWQGLARYLDDDDGDDQKARWASVEYAAPSVILDSPEASMTIYWDVVGRVGSASVSSSSSSSSSSSAAAAPEHRDNINGQAPPAWAISLSVKGGLVNYGPWADRQRADLQRTFFPSLCKDATPAEPLAPGAYRVPTQFKFHVELEEEATIRVPVREGSKNWKWKGKEPGPMAAPASRDRDKRRAARRRDGSSKNAAAAAAAAAGASASASAGQPSSSSQAPQRPYGWLDIKVAANTAVSYSADTVAGAAGYSSLLQVDMPQTEISSSINHEPLWRSGPQRITCDLSTPLGWNALRQWRFHIAGEDLELFLLRDHVFLLIDLVDDWTTGPPPDYLVFTPFRYHLDLRLHNIKLYLNVNDANIINNPTDLDDNTYLLLASPLLDSSVCIPADAYRPARNAIPFNVTAEPVTVALHAPPWNTQATFLSSPEIGRIESLAVDGAYHYHATTSPANTDTLVVNVAGRSPVARLHGFVIRYFLKVKDNYFGDDIHFKTLEEHQESLRLRESDPDADSAARPPPKQSNDLDVVLHVRADEPRVRLPANLYSSDRHVQVDTASLTCDVRFTNYYMDLALVLSPLSLSRGGGGGSGPTGGDGNTSTENPETPSSAADALPPTQLFVDGLSIYGHRLFGLPPVEPTYLCNWDVSVGDVTGECSPDFIAALLGGGKAFGFSLDDDENALVPYSSIIFHDVTFLRASVGSIHLWLHVDEAAFLLQTGPVRADYNDWARSHYSRRADISVPDVRLSCVDAESAARNSGNRSRPYPHRAGEDVADALALVQTSARVAVIGRKFAFSNERRLQQALVRREDQRTHRTEFLILPGLPPPDADPEPVNVNPPAQCFPDIPQPIRSETAAAAAAAAASSSSSSSSASQSVQRPRRMLRSKSSFLSLSGSVDGGGGGGGAVRRPSTRHRGRRAAEGAQYPATTATAAAPPGASRPATRHTREPSTSTGRHSAFYTVPGEPGDVHEIGRDTVAFSSQYLAPSFPLQHVQPDAGAFPFRERHEEDDATPKSNNTKETVGFDLDDIDVDFLGEDCALSSFVLELPTGLDASLTPASLRHLAALLAALQPSGPEDVLDEIQIDSVSDILDMQKAQKMKGHVRDLLVRVPRADIRFVNTADAGAGGASQGARNEQDQYDLSVAGLALASRSESRWEDAFDPESKSSRTSFHVRLRLAELSAAERFRRREDGLQAAVLAQTEHLVVSMAAARELTYLDLDVGTAQAHTSSRKIEYLASLVRRSAALASELGAVFGEATSRRPHLAKHLVHRLVTDRQTVPDAAFLVRPSAVLRSARQHLRTFDSWKLAMRLRQMWTTLSPEQRDRLRIECLAPQRPDLPDRIREAVVASFQQWRSWDLGDASENVLLNKIFGRVGGGGGGEEERGPVLAVARVREAQLVLDPGPKQNEIVFVDLTIRLEDANTNTNTTISTTVTPPADADAAGGQQQQQPPITTVLHVYCGDASVRLNWELCDLAQDILKLYADDAMQSKPEEPSTPTTPPPTDAAAPPPSSPARPPRRRRPRTIHYVACVGRASVVVETVNVQASCRSDGLKTSLVMRIDGEDGDGASDTNLVIGCDSAQSKLRYGAHQTLTKVSLSQPSVLVSHELRGGALPDETASRHIVKATASSRQLSLMVKQDPVVLAEVVDAVIRDEVAQLYRLQSRIQSSSSSSSSSLLSSTDKAAATTAGRLSTVRIDVAMFMDQYTIRVPLLRSLTYTITGTVSRAAMAASPGGEVVFDLDVKENSHEMQVIVDGVPRRISLLQIPPTNGRVTSGPSAGSGERSVTVFASLELVQLDASAVYSLLSALNRPEVSSTVDELQHQTQITRGRLADMFGAAEGGGSSDEKLIPASGSSSSSSDNLIYAVHLTFAGLQVFGSSPLKSDLAPLAHISFHLDSVNLAITNRAEQRGPVLAYPEVRINLGKISFEIQRGTAADAMDSCGSLAFGALITATSRIGRGSGGGDGEDEDEDGNGDDDNDEEVTRFFNVGSDRFEVELSADTISTAVDVLGYMGDKIKDLDTSRELEYLRKMRQSKPPRISVSSHQGDAQEKTNDDSPDIVHTFLSTINYRFEICDMQVAWLVTQKRPGVASLSSSSSLPPPPPGKEDLILSLGRIEFGTRTKNSARLTIENLQAQMVAPLWDRKFRSPNSALLPEIVFNIAYVSTPDARRLAFQAVGKSLDLQLHSGFVLPAAHLEESIGLSFRNAQRASQNWNPSLDSTATSTSSPSSPSRQRGGLLGGKRLESLLVDADFAGAVVHLTSKKEADPAAPATSSRHFYRRRGGTATSTTRQPSSASSAAAAAAAAAGKYGQFQEDAGSTVLRTPGLACKVEYADTGRDDPTLYAEVKVDASSNVIYPSVVPLIIDMTNTVKEVVSGGGKKEGTDKKSTENKDEEGTDDKEDKNKTTTTDNSILTTDPRAVLGRIKLNVGLRIYKQEFSLSCQPIARVSATAGFEDVYFTVNTVGSADQGGSGDGSNNNFFALSGAFTNLGASVQHVYSRESTGSFEVQSIVLSLMNSKHVSGTSGLSAIVKVSPMKIAVNARQLHDFLLFREIWMPREMRRGSSAPVAPITSPATAASSSQGTHLVQRYQQVAATAAFPWTATISVGALEISLDLGQSLGRCVFAIADFWVSSKKTSDWEQNLCLGFAKIGVDCSGRTSGFVALQDFQLRTSIKWPEREQALNETPLIQASVAFAQLRVKAAFDYQVFLVTDITSMELVMYNVRRRREGTGDRLVAIFDGGAVQAFGTTTSAAQAVALYQAVRRLMRERRAEYEASLKEIDLFLKRGPGAGGPKPEEPAPAAPEATVQRAGTTEDDGGTDEALLRSPILLDTDVVVTLKALNLGIFPSAFTDHQVFKMEASNAQARFAASVVEDHRIHSVLGLTLGQLRIGLAAVGQAAASSSSASSSAAATAATTTTLPPPSRSQGELSVEEVVRRATGSRGGTILKVPRVEATMRTWQSPDSNHIDYIFKSSFEGKVEVGWNYSRISYIRGMWASHAKALAQSYGRELPSVTAIRVTGVPEPPTTTGPKTAETGTITAEVNVPQSRYSYRALQPPVIETPQLRDMGEATPPLEWIGLQRDRLPNLTHQIVIVSLLELASEVEDAYSSILGSS